MKNVNCYINLHKRHKHTKKPTCIYRNARIPYKFKLMASLFKIYGQFIRIKTLHTTLPLN